MSNVASNRREFLTGGSPAAKEALAPSRGPTVMLRTTAMATDFDVILNPGGLAHQVEAASAALDEVHRLEAQLTIYRDDSEVARLNREAHHRPVAVDAKLYELLRRGKRIHESTLAAFDPASGAVIRLWQCCRSEGRIPDPTEVVAALSRTGMRHVQFSDADHSISFDTPGVEFNLGAIGKGHAVDQAGQILSNLRVDNWLIHGGKSSVLARGTHAGHDGWPIGLRNPLLPDRPYLTLLLKNAALSTSGTAVNWFRHEGKRYGHILDPRTGWPVETMLSVSVIAPDAALSDALSTAFFVLGVENSLQCCDNFEDVGVILFPLPHDGRTLAPIFHRVPMDRMFVDEAPG
jgi:thiamine biosynthesis lipoprotein